MQGLLVPNRLDLTVRQNRAYVASRCGLCQHLRDDYGPLARFLLSYDALALQLLVEAQSVDTPVERQVRCAVSPLRHTASADPQAGRFAAAVAVLIAEAKITDHLADARGMTRALVQFLGALVLWVVGRWSAKARIRLHEAGFDANQIDELLAQQSAVEAESEVSLEDAARPTSEGVGALFAHTATLSEVPENAAALECIGRAVGRSVYAIDALEDKERDRELSVFNPLLTERALLDDTTDEKARAVIRVAGGDIRRKLPDLELERHGAVLRNVLADSLPERGRETSEDNRSWTRLILARAPGGCCGEACTGCEDADREQKQCCYNCGSNCGCNDG